MTSNFFKRMFASNMKEAKSQEIELKEVELETIKNLISFMYKDKIDNAKITLDLLAAADMYQVQRLRSICSQTLSKSINLVNVSGIWHTVYLHNVKSLVEAATIFMVKNWCTLSKKDEVRELCLKYPALLFTISTLLAER